MRVLLLRGDRTQARDLRILLEVDGHELRSADTWPDLLRLLPDGPYALAILFLARHPAVRDPELRDLADATGGKTEIHLLTDDAALARRLDQERPGVFKAALAGASLAILGQGIQEAVRRNAASSQTTQEGVEETAPGIVLRRSTVRRIVERAGMPPATLTSREAEVLEALLAAGGDVLGASAISRQLGATGSLTAANLRTIVRELRGKVEEDPARPRHLITAQGHGYLWRRGTTQG